MKILVTGGAGFIGSHVVERFVAAGHSVSVVDDLTSGTADNVPSGVRLHKVDILDRPSLNSVFAQERPDLICHLAAQINVRKSTNEPALDATNNVIGSINVIEAGIATGSMRIIYAGSGGAIYGDVPSEELPATEDTPAKPLSPYGASKFAVELYLGMYARSHQLEYTSLRLSNVYGPRQDPSSGVGVVAMLVETMLADEPVTMYGDGQSSRDYTHVTDIATAFLHCVELPGQNVFNVGTGTGTTVLELFYTLSHIVGFERPPNFAPAPIGEVTKIWLDARRISEELGWKPSMDIETGLRNTVAYCASQMTSS